MSELRGFPGLVVVAARDAMPLVTTSSGASPVERARMGTTYAFGTIGRPRWSSKARKIEDGEEWSGGLEVCSVDVEVSAEEEVFWNDSRRISNHVQFACGNVLRSSSTRSSVIF